MKERQKIIEIAIKESAEICSIIPNEDGTFSLIDIQGNLVKHEQYQALSYSRSSGKPKVLRSIIRSSNDQVGENPWKKYDKIGFIDTNSLEKGNKKLFVCSSSLLIWEDEKRRSADVHPADLLVGYSSTDVNPERIGWHDFIQRLQASSLLSRNDRILVVVDNDKAWISSINNKIELVFLDFVLPDGFTIAYATSDSGAESWINKEITRRDKVPGRAMVKIQEDQSFLDYLMEAGYLYIKDTFEQDV